VSTGRRVRVAIETHGCRTNLVDSSTLARALVEAGAELVEDSADADVYVLLSCTVTGGADRDAGKALRRVRRENPRCVSVLAGCLPAASPGSGTAAIADLVVSGARPDEILRAALGRAAGTEGRAGAWHARVAPPAWSGFVLERVRRLSRAHVKIGEGCDGGCTYCIVPRARGPAVSRSREDVLADVSAALAAGFPEVVLSGTHLALWGRDLAPRDSLTGLMEAVERVTEVGRLRLSSLEPDAVLGEVAARMGRSRVWCRHVHVALQHGSDRVLERMGRKYRFEEALAQLRQVDAAVPGVGIGLDFIVGFPGETESDFDEALARLEGVPFSYLHVFAFSPRPGTPAAAMDGRPGPDEVRRRSSVLRQLGQRRRAAFARAQVGETVDVVMERRRVGARSWLTGLTDHYLRVYLDGDDAWMGKRLTCRVREVVPAGLLVSVEGGQA